MPRIDAKVSIFDPVLPSRIFEAAHPGIDTWHEHTLITRGLSEKVPTLRRLEKISISVSGGMEIECVAVELGVNIGNIRINRLTAALVDTGGYDILFGQDILTHTFGSLTGSESVARVSSAWKDDPEALAIEIYPVEFPSPIIRLEKFISSFRKLHNIGLIVAGEISIDNIGKLGSIIDNDLDIPESKRLRLTWVDSGSIWITVKSMCRDALDYSTRIFKIGAEAKLAQEVATAKSAETHVEIEESTRELTIERLKSEQEMLREENIAKTHSIWRKEQLDKLDFYGELTKRVQDRDIRARLLALQSQFIREIVDQGMYPIVRNLPRDREPSENLLFPPLTKK